MVRENRLSQIETTLQTGSREGMFTMETYYAKVIAPQNRFISPRETFRPTAETAGETFYESTLFRSTHPSSRAGFEGTGQADRQDPHSSQPTSYEIQEEATMIELIEELKREERFKSSGDRSSE
jgi:hypothetical protein